MIYIFLRGRIGNQLFMYAIAEELRFRRNCNEEIVIDDTEVLNAAIIKIVDSKVKHLVEEINTLKTNFKQYTTDTDDQLEDIEIILDSLSKPVEEAAKNVSAPATTPAQPKATAGTKPAETK